MEEKPIKEEESVEYLPPSRGQKTLTGLMVVGLCAVLAYAVMEHRTLKQLVASRSELSAELSQEQGQVQTLTQKLLAAQSVPTPAPAPQPQTSLNSATGEQAPVAHPSKVQHRPRRHTAVARPHPAEDPWRKQVQSELTEQQKLIAEDQRMIQETQDSVRKARADMESNLQSTRNDLNGSIAKNHEELVALERKGERKFYEFNLQKSKQFQREGPMSISLRKSNSKHKYCDLVLIVNDSEVSKNHVNLYEPILFYPEGYSQPLQVVINDIGKNEVRGYASEPKYKPSELAAGPSSSGGTAAQAATSPSTESATLKRRPATQE
jgi:hypothetical protein